MRRAVGFGVTVALLATIWGVLGAVAWVMGVLPDAPRSESPAPRADVDARVDDDAPIALVHDAGSWDAGASRPAPEVAEPPPASPPRRMAMRSFPLATTMRSHVTSLVAGQLVGDERPELVVGLGERFEVLAATDDPSVLRRVLVVGHDPEDPAQVLSSPRAAIGDVTGDARPDLVIGFWRRSDGGGSRGGGAWLLAGREGRAPRGPRRIAGPGAMVTGVSLLDLDGRGGLDLVIADRGRPWGDIPGRVLLLAGAARPRALGTLPGPTDVRMALPAHLDEDELVDLAIVGEVVTRHRNMGRGRFEALDGEEPGVLFADVPHGFSGDLNGDGRLEAYAYTNARGDATLVMSEDGTRRVPFDFDPRRDDDGFVYPIRALADIDGDGRNEALVLHSVGNDWRLASFDSRGEPSALRELHGGHPRRGHDGALVDLDGDGELELVTLDSVYDEGARVSRWEIAVTPVCVECAIEVSTVGTIEDAADLVTSTVR